MPEAEIPQALKPCAYHVLRYTPNLVRDEWVNIGILLFDPASGRLLQPVVEEPAEFARVRRLQPTADEELLRRLSDEFASQSAAAGGNAQAYAAPGANPLDHRATQPAERITGRGPRGRTGPSVSRSRGSASAGPIGGRHHFA